MNTAELSTSAPLLNAQEAANYLRSSPSTLAKLRMRGGGPKYIRPSSRRTLYRRTDLDAWLEEREAISTSDEAVR